MQSSEDTILALLNELNRKENFSEEEITSNLAQQISYLIAHDFGKLVEILYRVDVDENALKQRLAEDNATDSAKIIAAALFERQKQKLALRARFSSANNSECGEEKW